MRLDHTNTLIPKACQYFFQTQVTSKTLLVTSGDLKWHLPRLLLKIVIWSSGVAWNNMILKVLDWSNQYSRIIVICIFPINMKRSPDWPGLRSLSKTNPKSESLKLFRKSVSVRTTLYFVGWVTIHILPGGLTFDDLGSNFSHNVRNCCPNSYSKTALRASVFALSTNNSRNGGINPRQRAG